jgi:hypothetical protein
MVERLGANGMPMKNKESNELIQEVPQESNNMIQEILEENPNATCPVCGQDPCVCETDSEEE